MGGSYEFVNVKRHSTRSSNVDGLIADQPNGSYVMDETILPAEFTHVAAPIVGESDTVQYGGASSSLVG